MKKNKQKKTKEKRWPCIVPNLDASTLRGPWLSIIRIEICPGTVQLLLHQQQFLEQFFGSLFSSSANFLLDGKCSQEGKWTLWVLLHGKIIKDIIRRRSWKLSLLLRDAQFRSFTWWNFLSSLLIPRLSLSLLILHCGFDFT